MKAKYLVVFLLILSIVFSMGCSKEEKTDDVVSNVETKGTVKDDSGEKSGKPATKVTDTLKGVTDTAKTESKPASEKSTAGSTEEDAPAYTETETEAPESYEEASLRDMSSMKMIGATGRDGSPLEMPAVEDGYILDEFGADGDYDYFEDGGEPILLDPPASEPIKRPETKAGTLTAGEWNDNRNFMFLKKLITDGQNYTYKNFFTNWELTPFNRLVITCKNPDDKAITGASVTVIDGSGKTIWKGVTDHTGTAYAYYGLLDPDMMPQKVHAEYGSSSADYEVKSSDMADDAVINITLEGGEKKNSLDLMFTIDTTGSMGDEIYYLQTELEDVINKVKEDTSVSLRLSVNFYRDIKDDYVVKPYEFSENIDEQLKYLNSEYANGGGDYEEAVELALESSINEHTWKDDSIKLLFLVLDAPPHNTEEVRESLKKTLSKASEMGVRIIPIASSGIDKDTEFLLRTFAMTTGGTYTFLTSHSGVGDSHIEPTIGSYTVEQLNDLLVRVIEEYIG